MTSLISTSYTRLNIRVNLQDEILQVGEIFVACRDLKSYVSKVHHFSTFSLINDYTRCSAYVRMAAVLKSEAYA